MKKLWQWINKFLPKKKTKPVDIKDPWGE